MTCRNSVSIFLLILPVIIPNKLFAQKTALTPEQESSILGKKLKPISDDVWRTVAGERTAENYAVVKGDTLSDISKRLFGDPKYWPKIWSMNNGTITNPHHLQPGFQVAFSAGSGSSLPSLSVDGGSEVASDAPSKHALISKKRGSEWKHLPKQSWEIFKILLPPEVDPSGIDARSKYSVKVANGFDAIAFPSDQEIPYMGQIIGSKTEGQTVSLNDLVYIQADEKLQIGETYAIVQEPQVLKSPKSDRVGYSYFTLGKVKILAVQDHIFLGKIEGATDFVPRGSFLVPMPPRVPQLTPIAGPRPIPGILILDHRFSTYSTAQHKEVFIDRGTEDGIQPGMVFRAYQHVDPSTSKTFSRSNFVIEGHFIVTQASANFSSALVMDSYTAISENSAVILLTDLSDLHKNPGYTEKGPGEDDLDALDDGQGLGKAERRELKQLEDWKKNPETPPPPVEVIPSPTPLASPSSEPSPIPTPEEIPPPAPEPTPEPNADVPADAVPSEQMLAPAAETPSTDLGGEINAPLDTDTGINAPATEVPPPPAE